MRNNINKQHALHGKILIAVVALYFLFMLMPTVGFMQAQSHYLTNKKKDLSNPDKISMQLEKNQQKSDAGSKNTANKSGNITADKSSDNKKAGSTGISSQNKRTDETPKASGKSSSNGSKSDKKQASTAKKGTGNKTTDKTQLSSMTQSSKQQDKSGQQGRNGSDVKSGTTSTPNGEKPATEKKDTAANRTSDQSTQGVKGTSYPAQQPSPPKHSKVAYLTFDDGPTPSITPLILDILSQYKIKASFFVLGEFAVSYPDLIKRTRKEGHFIGNHTYSHRYHYIYSSTNVLLDELRKTDSILASILGDDYIPGLMRFPGGSFGDQLKPFREAVKQAGYRYIDWNALNGDSEALDVPTDKLYQNIVNTTAGKNEIVILMHDSPGKETTVQALPGILDFLKSQGYVFETLKDYKNLHLSVMN